MFMIITEKVERTSVRKSLKEVNADSIILIMVLKIRAIRYI